MVTLTSNYDLPSVFARNILIQSELLEYYEPIKIETETKMVQSHLNGVKNRQVSNFEVFPNPCSNYITIKLGNENFKELRLINQKGEILINTKIINNQKELVLSMENFSSGIFFIEMTNSCGIKEVKKILHKN